MSTRVYLSLGSNIQPEQTIRSCLAALKQRFGSIEVSPIYQTPAEGFEGDDFLNLVVGIQTELIPLALFNDMRAIEAEHGRDRSEPKFAARTLDIDILTYGSEQIVSAELNLPRDEILKYAFVLRPLADLASREIMPGVNKTYGELWQAMASHAPAFTVVELA